MTPASRVKGPVLSRLERAFVDGAEVYSCSGKAMFADR